MIYYKDMNNLCSCSDIIKEGIEACIVFDHIPVGI